MSSLNATQADGYYIPPEYIDSGAYKKKSISKFNGSKGHNQFLQNSVVRFELPYDGFCEKCKAHVGKGTRFNAHKAHVGDYFTTKIYEFTMKCRACKSQSFSIRTNPKERCFDYVKGIHKKVEEFNTVDAGTLGVIDTEKGNGIEQFTSATEAAHISEKSDDVQNSISKLEKRVAGERKSITDRDAMELLLKQNKMTMFDDAASNSNLRAKYRKKRKAKKKARSDALTAGLGRGIELSESTKEDKSTAQHIFYEESIQNKKSRKEEKEKFSSIRSGSIFSSSQRTACQSDKRKAKVHKSSHSGDKSSAAAASSCVDKSTNDKSIRKTKKITINHTNGKIKSGNKDPSISLDSESSAHESSLLALNDYASDSDESD